MTTNTSDHHHTLNAPECPISYTGDAESSTRIIPSLREMCITKIATSPPHDTFIISAINGTLNFDVLNALAERFRARDLMKNCLFAFAALQDIDVSCTNISDDDVKHFAVQSRNKVKSLTMDSCAQITPEALKALSHYCTDLVNLSLSFCVNVNDKALSYISRIKPLKDLNLRGMCHLCSSLLAVYSSYTYSTTGCLRIMDKGIQYLTALPHLEMLSLAQCIHSVTYFGIHSLSEHAKFKHTLRSLDISKTPIRINNILTLLESFTHLRVLNLSECYLYNDDDVISVLLGMCMIHASRQLLYFTYSSSLLHRNHSRT